MYSYLTGNRKSYQNFLDGGGVDDGGRGDGRDQDEKSGFPHLFAGKKFVLVSML
jgi:hypothetical protein